MRNLLSGLCFTAALIAFTFSLALGFALMLFLCVVDWAFEKAGSL